MSFNALLELEKRLFVAKAHLYLLKGGPGSGRHPGGGSARDRYRQQQVEARMGTTNLTERHRVMERGYHRQLGEKLRAQAGTPDRWERRRLASLPGAKFDAQGNLSNLEEMRARHGSR